MKKRILLIILLIGITISTSVAQNVFDKFEEYDAVEAMIVNAEAFRMLGQIGGESSEAKEIEQIAKSLTGLKVFSTTDATVGAEMKMTFDKYIKSKSLTELMRVKDKDGNTKIYVKKGKDEDHVTELVMFIKDLSNKEIIIVSLSGDIDLNNIHKVTDKMNIKGVEKLK